MNPQMILWLTLLAKLGVETTFALWSDWRNKNEPTEEMWNNLLKLSRKKMQDYLDAVPTSPTPPPA